MNRYKKARTVCKSLKNGAGVYQSCHAAGISPTTLWNWRNEKPKFDKFINKIFESRTQMVIDALYKKALEGNPTAQIFWLKNKAGWKDSPLIDQAQHSHITFVYKQTNGNKLQSPPLAMEGLVRSESLPCGSGGETGGENPPRDTRTDAGGV